MSKVARAITKGEYTYIRIHVRRYVQEDRTPPHPLQNVDNKYANKNSAQGSVTIQ